MTGAWSFELEPFLASIPGQDKFVGWGEQVIFTGIIVSVAYEMFCNRERANLLGVVARGIVAILILKGLSGIGSAAQDVCWSMATSFEKEGLRTVWISAFKTWMGGTLTAWSKGTLTATFLGWCSLAVTMGVFIVKIAVLKVAYPFFLAKAVWSGLISVPLSAFPGVNKPKDFFVNVITVALWPVTHALITALFAALFQGLLEAVATTDLLGFWETVYKIWESPDATPDTVLKNTTAVVVHFVLISAMFVVATACTPKLTVALVTMEPISQFATTITTAGMALVAAGASTVAASAGGSGLLGSVASAAMTTARGLDKAGDVANAVGGVARGIRNLTGANSGSISEMDARPLVNER